MGAKRLEELAASTSESLDSILPVVPITEAVKAVGGVLNTAAEKVDLLDVQGSKEVREFWKYSWGLRLFSTHQTFCHFLYQY